VGDSTQAPTGSVWEQLREQHREVTDERDPLYIDDPVHDGVVFRYRYVPLEASEKSLKRVSKVKGQLRQAVALGIDRILLCLDEILIAAPDGEIPLGHGDRKLYSLPLKPLSDDGVPMKFDERLCDAMGFPPGTAKSAANIVRKWFAGNGYAIADHAGEVSEWLAEVSSDVRDEFEESLGKA
jgi:hypothetical protein